jgi:hypothetical protein
MIFYVTEKGFRHEKEFQFTAPLSHLSCPRLFMTSKPRASPPLAAREGGTRWPSRSLHCRRHHNASRKLPSSQPLLQAQLPIANQSGMHRAQGTTCSKVEVFPCDSEGIIDLSKGFRLHSIRFQILRKWLFELESLLRDLLICRTRDRVFLCAHWC